MHIRFQLFSASLVWGQLLTLLSADLSMFLLITINTVCTIFLVIMSAMLSCKLYEQLRREAAALKIQKNFRCHVAHITYTTLHSSAIMLQTGMRAMVARNDFRYRKHTKAAIKIQEFISLLLLQCLWSSLSYMQKIHEVLKCWKSIISDTWFAYYPAGSCTWPCRLFLLQKSSESCDHYSVWLEATGRQEGASKSQNGLLCISVIMSCSNVFISSGSEKEDHC